MTNTELTLEQLQAVSGGIIDGGCRPPIKVHDTTPPGGEEWFRRQPDSVYAEAEFE